MKQTLLLFFTKPGTAIIETALTRDPLYFLQVCPYQQYLGTGISRPHHCFRKYLRIEQFNEYLRIYQKLVLETGGESQIQDLLIRLKVFFLNFAVMYLMFCLSHFLFLVFGHFRNLCLHFVR